MALIADSGAVYGLYDRDDTAHRKLRAAVEKERGPLVIAAPCLGEIDYLLRARLGNPALLQFVADVRSGAFRIECLTSTDLERCHAVLQKYSDIDLGLSDASVGAIAERLGIDTILTVDRRDFQVLRTSRGKRFRLLP